MSQYFNTICILYWKCQLF